MELPIHKPVHRVVNLIPDDRQQVFNGSLAEAREALLEDSPESVRKIEGSFALVARDGERVSLARSLDRPLRYFLAKETAGPLLVVAERLDEIRSFLEGEGYGGQFHPTYTRMVPAHHVTRLRLIGCPDPNPEYLRFFDPPRAVLPADLDLIGERYLAAMVQETLSWLRQIPEDEPVGVLFSGGLDSGAVLLAVYRSLLNLGMSPARLKAFTLAVDGGGADASQAREVFAQGRPRDARGGDPSPFPGSRSLRGGGSDRGLQTSGCGMRHHGSGLGPGYPPALSLLALARGRRRRGREPQGLPPSKKTPSSPSAAWSTTPCSTRKVGASGRSSIP